MNDGPTGILLVDKPVGMSSHSAVAAVRRGLGLRRVGHAGTLDPAASGLLVMGVGAGTRLLTFLVGLDKTYLATIRLGIATDTDDAEGDQVRAVGCPADVDIPWDRFRGALSQRPSSVSAIKVDGRRAYARVRAGEAVELPERPVTVHSLELLRTRPATAPTEAGPEVPVVDLDVSMSVSSGTYVRAIARDLGDVLGVGGHLTALRRTRVGPFDVTGAPGPDGIDPAAPLLALGDVARQVLPTRVLTDDDAAAARHGVRLPCDQADVGPVALLAADGSLISVATCSSARWRHLFVVPSATLDLP